MNRVKENIKLCIIKDYISIIHIHCEKEERNALFNNALKPFYLQLYGFGLMVKDHSAREETCCSHHTGYPFQLAARVLSYVPSHTG